jgi:hypothetical protein
MTSIVGRMISLSVWSFQFIGGGSILLSKDAIRTIIAIAIMLHGIAHAIAVIGLTRQAFVGESRKQLTLRSWLFPGASARLSAAIAFPFWLASAVMFLISGGSLWRSSGSSGAWRQPAVAGAAASCVGIVLASGIWPGSPGRSRSILNTSIAVAMNLVIVIALQAVNWPEAAVLGW